VFFELKRREIPLIPPEEMAEFDSFIDKMFASPEFYKKHASVKFKTKKPSELKGENWIEVWRNNGTKN
jgi:hypothetical protein